MIFPEANDSFMHGDFARIHRASDVRVVAAGFFQKHDGKVFVLEEQSETLPLPPRAEDAALIQAIVDLI